MFKQNQKIKFNDGVNEGTGKICGIALTAQSTIGTTYIIELDNQINGYSYTHLVCAELYMQPLSSIVKSNVATDRKDSPHHHTNRLD